MTRPLLALAAGLAVFLAAPAGGTAASCPSPLSVERAFPTGAAERTRWAVVACDLREGVVIARAAFRTAPEAAFVQVLDDARVSEIFVPYHDGRIRFFDVSDFAQGLTVLGSAECPAPRGQLALGARVCVEMADRGLAWKDDIGARRGEELRIWGVVAVTNYKYVIEWAFRDDGAILGRVGATGRNLPGHHESTHTHTITWRLDVDLDGPEGDSVRVTRHREQGLAAKDPEMLVSGEGGLVWEPGEFTTLGVYDEGLANAKGRRTSYRLVPLRFGRARHAEAFTHADFWVTRQTAGSKGAELRARDLPAYVTPPEPVGSGDLVLWYTSSIHHIERDEDDDGATQAMYVGFQLVPANLFSASPLYP